MSKEIQVYLEDINECVLKIEKYIRNVNKHDFLNDDELQDAVIRRFAIIGEAAGKIPQEFKDKYPNIPWKKMIGMRNILIHVYSEANYESIWDTIENDLPKLKKQITKLLKGSN